MASCKYKLPFKGSSDDLISKIKKDVKKEDGKYSGDSGSGKIEVSTSLGTIKGKYNISDSNIEIEITEKPSLISCSKIEDELKKLIKN